MEDFDSEDRRGSGRRGPGRRDSGRPNRRSFSGRPDRSSGRPDRGFNRREFRPRGSEERTMHKVTCDACGEICEVPFKPTEGKPIYCDSCFKKNKSSGSDKGNQFAEQLAQINEKLDKILAAIESSS